MKKLHVLLAGAAFAAGVGVSGEAAAVNFNPIADNYGPLSYVTYGDGNSYSLPVSAFFYNRANGGGTGPGNPYYVSSGPGQIQDLVVVATGASGGPVNTNFPGMDNAYATPNSPAGNPFKYPFFSTGTVADPAPTGAWDSKDTWDTSLTSMSAFLGAGNDMVFFFNNNQVNSGAATNQNLAAWMRITLKDLDGVKSDKIFDFTNNKKPYAPYNAGGGGVLNGDPTAYTSTGADPLVGTNSNTDYVMSGGKLCSDASGQPVPCDGSQAETFNHNLGANQAAYAVLFPEVNDILNSQNFGGYDAMSLDIRLGCPEGTPADVCVGRSLNNGYEQLFIGSSARPTAPVPEPATMLLLGSGLAGMAGLIRRRIRK